MPLPSFLSRAACRLYLDLPAFSFLCVLVSLFRLTLGMNAAPLGDNLISFGRVRPLFPGGFAHGGVGDEDPIYMFAFGMGLGMAFRAASGAAVIGLL